MYILRNVVAKLWMTIIGLVAVVLLILGLFLFQFLDTSFPKSADQEASFIRIGDKVAIELAVHPDRPEFVEMMNDVLRAQDAGLKVIQSNAIQWSMPLLAPGEGSLRVGDVFSKSDLEKVFAGQRMTPIKVEKLSGRNNEDFLIMAIPLKENASSSSGQAVIVYQSLKTVENITVYVKKLFAFVSVVGFLLTTFFAFFLITRITRPLSQLNKAADLITKGEYETRVPVQSKDEIGELAGTFNLMSARLKETITDLNHEKDNLASVLISMQDSVIAFDIEGRVIFANPQGSKLISKWNEIDWDKADESEISIVQNQIPQPLQNPFNSIVQHTVGLTDKLHVRNGVWSLVMVPLYSSGGLVRGAVAVLREVTEEFRLDKLRKDFVANVSHELRTPLSMLQGYSEALIDDIATSPQERAELVQVIHDESLRMGRLVQDLLDLARMEAGHMAYVFHEVDLSPLIRRVQRKFQNLCNERGIRLEITLQHSELLMKHADEDRLEQVLTNLLDNAMRHTQEGKKISIVANNQVVDGRKSIYLEISDEGQGIMADDLPYIFERFYKADKARTRGTSGGTGLGLAIVRNIVEAHNGRINVRSTFGEGAVFMIVLPTEGI